MVSLRKKQQFNNQNRNYCDNNNFKKFKSLQKSLKNINFILTHSKISLSFLSPSLSICTFPLPQFYLQTALKTQNKSFPQTSPFWFLLLSLSGLLCYPSNNHLLLPVYRCSQMRSHVTLLQSTATNHSICICYLL